MLTVDEIKSLTSALELNIQAEQLHSQADELLKPIVHRIVATGDIEKMENLASRLPRGFYRSELRVIINQAKAES